MSALKLKNAFFFSFLLFFMQFSYAGEKDVSVVGVLAMWGEKTTSQMWQPTINYLNKTIPNHHFILKTLKLGQIDKVVKQNSIDFILTHPGNYIELEERFGISRLATLKTRLNNQASNQFSAVIFTHKNRDDIQSLDDLRNKSFMGVKENVLGGFQMAWLELNNLGIDPFEDFSSLQFSGHPQDKIVYMVLKGEVDAGTVRTSVLERMASKNLIDINKLKILNRQSNSHFPFIHSTKLYPEWPIAKLKNTTSELAKAVSIALLKLPEDSSIAKQARSSGWTVALDYSPVRHLFKTLNLEPYKQNQSGFLERYWVESLLVFLLLLQTVFLYIYKLRTNLRLDEEKLAQSETEWANALDFLDEPIFMADLNDRIIRANKAYYRIYNTNAKEVIGQLVTNFSYPCGEDVTCKVCLVRKDLIDTVITLEADDYENIANIPLEISIKVIRDNHHQPIGIIQKMRDLTQSREAEKAIRRNELLFKELLNATPDPLLVINADGAISLVNTEFEKEFGYSREEIIDLQLETIIPEKYRSNHVALRTGHSFDEYNRPMGPEMTLEAMHKDGSSIPCNISLNPFSIDNEKFIIATIHNITTRLEKEVELRRLASIPEYNPNPIIEFKKDRSISYANPAAFELFPDITKGKAEYGLFSKLDEEVFLLDEGAEIIRDIELGNSTYEQKIIYSSETEQFRMYIWDITKIKHLTQEMTYQATHDSLTNLINRREFENQLKQSTKESRINNITHSLCFMDLDRFKVINDSCGHIAGDELLKQLSSTLFSIIRGNDTFARLGGDEFGLLLNGCSLEKAKVIAKNIQKTVEDFRFKWDKKIFKIGISIGIATINPKSISSKEILNAADTACYLAKKHGRNRVHIYNDKSSAITEHTNETNWLNRINTAIDNNKFILYFQQITAVNNKKHKHYEVLIRMIDHDGKIILPNSFIPAAERFDIMSTIDSWVLKNTLSIIQTGKYSNIEFSINLSGQSLGDPKFMNHCISQIAECAVDTNKICFEITETAMIKNLSHAIRSISTLRGLGCKIALDDFGSGLSSFAYLKNLPVDYLKIDGSLIKGLDTDPINVTMVNSIIHIGHTMGLKTIAEYVENDDVLNILRDMNVDYVQGYAIAEPVVIEDIKIE